MSLTWVDEAIKEIDSSGLLRRLKTIRQGDGRTISVNGKPAIDFAGNDYLGLKSHPDIKKAAIDAVTAFGMGAGASRLLSGNHHLYEELEKEIADYKQYQDALIFNSGYVLNLSVIQALIGKGDAVILDRLDHASLIDGARLSGAKIMVYPHADMNGLEKALKSAARFRRRLIVTDTIFSMDGDIAPLKDIAVLSSKYDAMVLADEAHATGVIGTHGVGAVEMAGLSGRIEIVMGTFSKALGSLGAYLVCGKKLKVYMVNTARGLIYTTAMPPSVVAASLMAIKIARDSDDRRKRLSWNATRLRQLLNNNGFDTGKSETPIIPVIVKDEKEAVSISEKLLSNGYYAPAIRFPTVKKGMARLRITLSSEHTDAEIDGLAASICGAVS